jgi:hypothetical protein
MVPVVGLPLVSCVVPFGRENRMVTALLLGRLTRVEGKPVAAEVRVMTEGGGAMIPTGRFTMVPAGDIEAITPAAAALILDDGDPPRSPKSKPKVKK